MSVPICNQDIIEVSRRFKRSFLSTLRISWPQPSYRLYPRTRISAARCKPSKAFTDLLSHGVHDQNKRKKENMPKNLPRIFQMLAIIKPLSIRNTKLSLPQNTLIRICGFEILRGPCCRLYSREPEFLLYVADGHGLSWILSPTIHGVQDLDQKVIRANTPELLHGTFQILAITHQTRIHKP